MARSISGDSRRVAAIAIVAALLIAWLGSRAPAVADTSRERCRAGMQLAPRARAVAACDDALAQGASAEDLWAAASVRVSRVEAPSPDDLIRADVLAAAAARLAPGEPWGALAHLEVAVRWGDRALIDRRVDELERVAPADPRAQAAVVSARAGSRVGLLFGWGLLLLVCAVTAAHAAWRARLRLRRARTRVTRAVAVAAVGALLVIGTGGSAHATVSEAFPIDDADPEQGVPTPAEADARPIDFAYYLQALTERADAAVARGDHAAAARYDRALARAVPDSSLPQQRLCAALVAQGDRAAAVAACRAALGLSGVRAEDFVRFGDLVLAGSAPTAAELDDVEAAARHLIAETDPPTRVLGFQLECRLGVRTHRDGLLEECTGALAIAAPTDASTIVFQWTLAVDRGERGLARRLIGKARTAGVSAAGLARMQSATDQTSGAADHAGMFALAGALVLAGLIAIAIVRARRGAALAAA